MEILNEIVSFQDEIGLKEWANSLRDAHKKSQELLGSMARKAGKIYGTERESSKAAIISGAGAGGATGATGVPPKSTNGSN